MKCQIYYKHAYWYIFFSISGTYDLASRTVKFSQETYIATAEYDAQFEYTPDTEEEDGSCKSYMTYIALKLKRSRGKRKVLLGSFRHSSSFVVKGCRADLATLGGVVKVLKS